MTSLVLIADAAAVNWAESLTAWTQLAAAVLQLVTVVVAVVALVFAWRQIGGLNDTLKVNRLAAMLQIETELNLRKKEVDAAVFEAMKIGKQDSILMQVNVAATRKKLALENWFNAVDRLACSILNDYIPASHWKADYQQYIANLVNGFPDWFDPKTTEFPHILRLHQRWSQEPVVGMPSAG